MAENITDVRDTIGKNDSISVIGIEAINVIERGSKKLENGNKNRREVKHTDLLENMVIAVFPGGNPNKRKDDIENEK